MPSLDRPIYIHRHQTGRRPTPQPWPTAGGRTTDRSGASAARGHGSRDGLSQYTLVAARVAAEEQPWWRPRWQNSSSRGGGQGSKIVAAVAAKVAAE